MHIASLTFSVGLPGALVTALHSQTSVCQGRFGKYGAHLPWFHRVSTIETLWLLIIMSFWFSPVEKKKETRLLLRWTFRLVSMPLTEFPLVQDLLGIPKTSHFTKLMTLVGFDSYNFRTREDIGNCVVATLNLRHLIIDAKMQIATPTAMELGIRAWDLPSNTSMPLVYPLLLVALNFPQCGAVSSLGNYLPYSLS